MGPAKSELLGISFTLITAALYTSGEQSVQALNGCIPEFQLNALRLTGKWQHTLKFTKIHVYVPMGLMGH